MIYTRTGSMLSAFHLTRNKAELVRIASKFCCNYTITQTYSDLQIRMCIYRFILIFFNQKICCVYSKAPKQVLRSRMTGIIKIFAISFDEYFTCTCTRAYGVMLKFERTDMY